MVLPKTQGLGQTRGHWQNNTVAFTDLADLATQYQYGGRKRRMHLTHLRPRPCTPGETKPTHTL